MNPASPPVMPSPTQADPSQFGNYSHWAQEQMAKGFTPDQLHASLQQNGTAVQPPHSGNFLTHLLPTIGSIGGLLLAPETGGLSLLAAAGLSGLGAAGGKAVENATEGKSILDKSDLTAGIEGAVGGAAGGAAGKVIGGVAGKLGSAAENMGAKEASQTAAQDAIDTAANTYKDVSPQLQKALNAKDSLGHVTDMGYDIADPSNLVHVSNTSNDILNDTLNRALANSGPVDLSHFPQIVKDALAKESGTLGSFEPVAVARGRLGPSSTPAAKLLSQLENMGNAPGETTGSAIAKVSSDPNELRTLTTKLGQLAQDNKPTVTAATGAIDPQQRAIYNVINDVRGNVKDALYNRPEVSDALKGEVGNITADPAANITPQLADHLNGVVTNGGTAQDLLDEISKNINIGRLGEEGQKVGNIVTSTGAKARAAAEAGLEPNAGNTGNPVLDTAASLVNPHAGMITGALGAAKHVAQNPAILDTLSRIGDMGAKLAPAAGAAIATSPNLAADPLAQPGAGGTMGGTMNNQPMMASGTTDPNSMASILAQYMHMGTVDPYLLSSTSPVVQALAPQVQKQQLLGSEMNGLPGSFANAGGAQGLGGILSHITGLIPGSAANTYEHQSSAIANQLAGMLGISPQAAAGLVPQLMQNGQSAGITSGILGNMQGQLAL